MLTDLRAVNRVIWPMSSLEPGITLHSLLPIGWSIRVIDLKRLLFFFLKNQTFTRIGEKLAFTVPTYNISQPVFISRKFSTREVKQPYPVLIFCTTTIGNNL